MTIITKKYRRRQMNKESKYISIIAISFTIAFIGCLICTGVIYSKKTNTVQKEYEKVYVYVDVAPGSRVTLKTK